MSHSINPEIVTSFYYYGKNTNISANGQFHHPELILIGDRVTIKKDYCIQSTVQDSLPVPKIILGDDCICEEGLTLHAINRIEIKSNVIIGCNVSISDARHEYREVGLPVLAQGWTNTGEVIIGEGTRIGDGTVIAGNIRIGKHSIINQGSVVEEDLPDYCVAGGSPAQIQQHETSILQSKTAGSDLVLKPDTLQDTNQPDYQNSKLPKASLNLLNYANFLYNQQNYENAAVFYEKFLLEVKTLNKETSEAYGRLSDCYVSAGDVDKALLAAFRSFVYGVPHPVICYKIGNIFMQKKQLNMAIFWFDMATKETISLEHINYDASFTNWLPHLQLCICYESLGEHEKAYHHHQLSQKYHPDHPSVLYNQKYFESLFSKLENSSKVQELS